MAGVGFIAAPVLFGALPRADAGRIAGRLFLIDAYLGLALGGVLLLLALRQARAEAGEERFRFSTDVLLALGALFCTVAGHFGLQPVLEAARAGSSAVSFAALHGVASVFFVVKLAAVAALAWRQTRAWS